MTEQGRASAVQRPSQAIDARSAVGGTTPLLEVRNAEIGYVVEGQYHPAVGDASFSIQPGETLVLLGPSGCGKSTLLKAIAGFLPLRSGTISLQGKEHLSPGPDRAVVFQEFDQLFPWRNVLGNVAYPLRINGVDRAEAERRSRHYLDMMGLTPALKRYPHQLSGGMKQRVAIARAFALQPVMLLMDEPFGSLDAQTRSRLQRELIDIVARTQVTILFVTHSIQEAVLLGHRVVTLGRAPSRVKDITDVRDVSDPDTAEFVEARRHLRGLLTADEDDDHAIIE